MAERPYVALMRALSTAGVQYAIAGGFAVVLHGVPRMTFDLDVVVNDADDNMQRLVEVLDAQGFQPRLPVALALLADRQVREGWIRDRNLIAFTLMHPVRVMEEVDVLLVTPFPWSEIAGSIAWRTLEGVNVPVVGRAVLRGMKLAAGRDKDLQDAALLADES